MKADMSVSAVTVRLKMLGELWELSVKLMRAKQLSSETPMLGEEPVAIGGSKQAGRKPRGGEELRLGGKAGQAHR